MTVTAYPLQWPTGRVRREHWKRESSNFDTTVASHGIDRHAVGGVVGVPLLLSPPVQRIDPYLGMSGECGCGAYAQRGELARWKKVDPVFGARIESLQEQVLERGMTWGWEGHPPKGGHNPNQGGFFPMCTGCLKSAVVQEEMA